MLRNSEPFNANQAIAAGEVTEWEIRKDHDRVLPGVYVPAGTEIDAYAMALAVGHWAKGFGIITGRSAAALHRCEWIDATDPAEINLPTRTRPPEGIIVRRENILVNETCEISRLAVTTPARTAFDLARHLPLEQAVAYVDALARATGIDADDILVVAAAHPRCHGMTQLREVLSLMDAGAESLPESHLRVALIKAGLPRPETQIKIRDQDGRIVAKADLGWRNHRVTAEYDGEQHWTEKSQRTWDTERTLLIRELGWEEIRVSADHLGKYRWRTIERIEEALRVRGWDG